MQQQKLRRPKSDEEEAREIAKRLEELADEEDFVYATLAGLLDPDQKPMTDQPPMPMANPAHRRGRQCREARCRANADAGSAPKPGETPTMPARSRGDGGCGSRQSQPPKAA